jgi:hypothetical protein
MKRCPWMRYDNEHAALSRLARIQRKHGADRERAAYPCGKCNGWHLARRP